MPIRVTCPSCEASIGVRDEQAGKRGRCPRCRKVFIAPVIQPPSSASDEAKVIPEPLPITEAELVPPEKSPLVADQAENGSGYALADGATKKAKVVRARQTALPGVGVSAKGVIEAAAPTRRTMTPKQILSAFQGEIEPVRPTILYRLWIAIVAGVMVLLPLLYVGIIALVVAGLVYHAVNHVSMFRASGARGGMLKVVALVYIGPLIAGVVVVALMLKPLFARPGRGPKQRVLDPGAEPLLHAFVDGVCASVGSPRPARIAVDCRVNASAHREGGLLGVVGGQLVLTIGLPFVAGVTLKQFAGVLAHEFGHFAQGAGMRLFALIMRINHWFARVVYQRDEWDESLESWSSNQEGFIIILVLMIRAAVWITRRILWVLMQVGRVVSGFLSRQMEYDADRYEARMVGAEVFAETMWRFRVMNLAENGAYADLQSSWQQRRLPNNFPKLVLANIPQIPEPVIAAYRQAMETAPTGLFDTHPGDKDRIARTQREAPDAGIFQLDGPATDVFQDFDALAKTASLDMYKSAVGPGITSDQLFEVTELVETQTAAQEGDQAAGRFFLGALGLFHRLPLPQEYPSAPDDLKAAKQTLVQARKDLESTRADALAAKARVDEIRHRLYLADLALVYIKTGVKVRAAEFQLKAATTRAAEAARNKAEAELLQLDSQLEPFTSAASHRLTLTLALLETQPVADRVSEGRDRRQEARSLYQCAAHLGANMTSPIARLAHARQLLLGTLQAYEVGKAPKNQPLINAVLRASASLRDELETFRRKLGDAIDYPFEHADENVTLAKFALPPVLPANDNVGDLLDASGEAINRLAVLYFRALGRLAVTAEEVEHAVGLPPIAVEEPEAPRV